VTKKPDDETKKDRGAWIGAAARAMAESGDDGVRVEALARDLGVTKGSFYWHFRDRRELLDAVVAEWEQQGTEAFIATVEAEGGDAATRLRRIWALTSAGDLGTELSIRELARRDEATRAAVERVDDRRIGYLRQLFKGLGASHAEAEARSMLLYSLLIGDWFIAATHGRTSRESVLKRAVELLLTRA